MKTRHKLALVSLYICNLLILVYVRVVDVPYELTSLIGTDSVRYAHQSKQIIDQGQMPEVETLRSAPLGVKSSTQLTLYPYVIAGFYAIADLFSIKFEQFIIILPVLLFILTTSIIYLLAWRMFGHSAALLTTNILALTPPVLMRTYAGFADRDGLVLLLSVISFYFYIQSLRGDSRKIWFHRCLSSVAMLCLGLSWQGAGLFVAIVVTTEVIRLATDKSYNGQTAGLLAVWVIPMVLGLLFLKPGVYSHLRQPYAFVSIVYPMAVLVAALFVLVFRHFTLIQKYLTLNNRVPAGFSLILVLASLSFPFMSERILNALLPSLVHPFGVDPVLQAIGELQKAGALGWGLWPGVFLIPIVAGLLLSIAGISDRIGLHKYWTMFLVQIILFGTAFSRLVSGPSSINSIENSSTLGFYFFSIGLATAGLVFGFIHASLRHRIKDDIPPTDPVWSYIFLVVWLLGTLVSFRAAIRFTQFFAIPAVVLGSYGLLWPFKRWLRQDKQQCVGIFVALSIIWQIYVILGDKIEASILGTLIYVLLACGTLGVVFLLASYAARRTIGSQLGTVGMVVYVILLMAASPHPVMGGYASRATRGLPEAPLLAGDDSIKNALTWIRDSTDTGDVVAANWEYGSWLNLLSDRPTIVDEQQRLTWVQQMSQLVMRSTDVEVALEFLKAHQAKYLLLTLRDIHTLGLTSAENSPTDSSIPVFGNIVQKIHVKDDASHADENYYRYWLPDWQWIGGNRTLTLGDGMYSADTWAIVSVFLQCEESGIPAMPPKAIVELSLDGTVTYLPPERICHNGITVLHANEPENTLPCTLIIDDHKEDNPMRWHIVCVPSHVRSLLAVRLFLFNELGDIFERVYPDYASNVDDFAAQVWKIHYPTSVEVRPGYLQINGEAPTKF